MELRPGVIYLPDTDRLIIDGVTLSLSMLADFIAALRPGQRLGPVFLEKSAEKIVIQPMDVLDVAILMPHRSDRTVWS